jgi:hypothetical protein
VAAAAAAPARRTTRSAAAAAAQAGPSSAAADDAEAYKSALKSLVVRDLCLRKPLGSQQRGPGVCGTERLLAWMPA